MKLLSTIVVILLTACTGPTNAGEPPTRSTTSTAAIATTISPTLIPPQEPDPAEGIPEGPVTNEVSAAVDRVLDNIYTQDWDFDAIGDLGDLGDVRTAWLLADIMRFYQSGPANAELVSAFSNLTTAPQEPNEVSFVWATNHLLASDVPAWDGYAEAKARVFVPVDDGWTPFFENDVKADWRLITWGGVRPDDRKLDDNGPCNCIPALDHPETTDADGGDWYDDDRVVFGVVVGDQAIALPKHQMEVHEMVNMTLDGRELGIPYCTLCASAQAYFVDNVAGVDRVVLRTSGLLQRSNKLMYDLTTGSAINTFTGEALTGPLAEEGVMLEQVSVVASTWSDWKTAHPDTLILTQDAGLGRVYDLDPLRGRDDNGPIFPIGDVDPRLPVQEKVVGVIAPDGSPIAFPVTTTHNTLGDGPIEYEGLTVRLVDGIRIYDRDGEELPTHEAFWFAWSQFHESTLVWDEFGS